MVLVAHVRKLDNGRWEARYRAPDGRERARRFSTKRAANDHLAQVRTDLHRGTWVDPSAGRITYADWVERWLSTEVGLRPSTRARDDAYLRTHLLPSAALLLHLHPYRAVALEEHL